MEIKLLTQTGRQKLTSNCYLRAALEENGPVAFFRLLPGYSEFKDIAKVDKKMDCLVEWGIDLVAASEALKADAGSHLSFVDILLAILMRANDAFQSWPETKEGRPANRPLDTVFASTVDSLYSEQIGIRPNQNTRKISIVFLSDPACAHRFLPDPCDGKFYIFHGTSWISARSIENAIDTTVNSRFILDFGPGFYVTRDMEFCRSWVLDQSNWRSQGQPTILVFSLPNDYKQQCQCKSFYGEEWADLLIKTRRQGERMLGCEDIFEGPMCTDVSKVDQCKALPKPIWPDQLCFRSSQSVALLTLERVMFLKSI